MELMIRFDEFLAIEKKIVIFPVDRLCSAHNFRILYWFLDTIHEQTRETLKKGSDRLKVNSVNVEIRQKKAIINFLSVFTP